MRALLILVLTSLLAGGAMAQRGGGSRGGGGGMRGGGGFRSGGGGFRGAGGGFVGHGGGGFVGRGSGFVGRGGGFGFRGDFDRGFRGGFGFRSGFGFGLGGYWPYWGLNYWPGYYDAFDYGYPSYPYDYYGAYDYQPSPNVTVIYPNQAQPATNTVYVQRVRPETHTYDEYGQEVNPPQTQAAAPSSSPIYLVAMKDGVIRAAASYSVNGQTLHYVTLQHEEKHVPLSQVDRGLSLQLNRERHVQFQLPPQ